MAVRFNYRATRDLAAFLAGAAQMLGGHSKTWNEHIAVALMLGGELGGREIDGVTRYITKNAGRFHRTATALKASPTNFYEAAAGSVQTDVSAQMASLIFVNGAPFIARAFAASIIRPGDGGQWLTIPAIAEAYGKRAREFGDKLVFQPRGKNLGILTWRTVKSYGVLKSQARKGPVRVRTASSARASRRAATRAAFSTKPKVPVVYWCVRQITSKQDRSIFPPDTDIRDLVMIATARAMEELALSA